MSSITTRSEPSAARSANTSMFRAVLYATGTNAHPSSERSSSSA